MMQTKICIYYGRSVVGKFLRGMGLGRGELLSRSLPLPKVFSSLSVGYAATSPKGRGFFCFILQLHYTANCGENFFDGNIFEGSISTSAIKRKKYPPIKRNSHRAPSMMQTKICIHYGRSAVGKFLRGMGLGRGELLPRSLPLPKVFSPKNCPNPGWSAVGTALVESGFGRETPFSAERGLSSKVFHPLPRSSPSIKAYFSESYR